MLLGSLNHHELH